jgi:hypothetical protein
MFGRSTDRLINQLNLTDCSINWLLNLLSFQTPQHNQTGADDFQRLVKLSYAPSYSVEDGRALSHEDLTRLLVLANGYEMLSCVQECAQALRPFDTCDKALAFFRLVPDSLLHMKPLSLVTKEAGDALAMALGPVEALWLPGDAETKRYSTSYVLNPQVVTLPLPAIEAALRSEKLQLKSENYAFSLALWWYFMQPGTKEERRPLLKRLLMSLRYARMSSTLLASIAQIGPVVETGLLPSIMTRGIWRHDDSHRWFVVSMPISRVRNRARESYNCTFVTHFNRAAIEGLQEGASARASLGLLHGFPCYLRLLRKADGHRLSIKSNFLIADNTLDAPGGATWGEHDADEKRGFEAKVIQGVVGGIEIKRKMYRISVQGSSIILKCPPAAFLYSEDDKLEVTLTLQVKQHTDC